MATAPDCACAVCAQDEATLQAAKIQQTCHYLWAAKVGQFLMYYSSNKDLPLCILPFKAQNGR